MARIASASRLLTKRRVRPRRATQRNAPGSRAPTPARHRAAYTAAGNAEAGEESEAGAPPPAARSAHVVLSRCERRTRERAERAAPGAQRPAAGFAGHAERGHAERATPGDPRRVARNLSVETRVSRACLAGAGPPAARALAPSSGFGRTARRAERAPPGAWHAWRDRHAHGAPVTGACVRLVRNTQHDLATTACRPRQQKEVEQKERPLARLAGD